MRAALSSCREAVETLLVLGADPDILTSGGCPALFFALMAGDQVIIERLAMITTKGDDIHWSDNAGDLPWSQTPLAREADMNHRVGQNNLTQLDDASLHTCLWNHDVF